MITMRRSLIAAALLLPILVSPLFAQPPSITGQYDVRGVEPDGTDFTGRVVVEQNGSAVRFTWNFDGEVSRGRGEINGDVVTVHYGDRYPAIYRIMSERELHGTYENGAGIENLYRN